jgi:hypothetical protein
MERYDAILQNSSHNNVDGHSPYVNGLYPPISRLRLNEVAEDKPPITKKAPPSFASPSRSLADRSLSALDVELHAGFSLGVCREMPADMSTSLCTDPSGLLSSHTRD